MKNIVILICIFSTFSAAAANWPEWLVEVSSVYKNKSGDKVKYHGTGFLIHADNRHFVFTVSHLSQGNQIELSFYNSILPNDVLTEKDIIGRWSDNLSDVEILEIAPVDREPLAVYQEDPSFFPMSFLLNKKFWEDLPMLKSLPMHLGKVVIPPWSEPGLQPDAPETRVAPDDPAYSMFPGYLPGEQDETIYHHTPYSLLYSPISKGWCARFQSIPGTSGSPVIFQVNDHYGSYVGGILKQKLRLSDYTFFTGHFVMKDVLEDYLVRNKRGLKKYQFFSSEKEKLLWALTNKAPYFLYRQTKSGSFFETPLNVMANIDSIEHGGGESLDNGGGESLDNGGGESLDNGGGESLDNGGGESLDNGDGEEGPVKQGSLKSGQIVNIDEVPTNIIAYQVKLKETPTCTLPHCFYHYANFSLFHFKQIFGDHLANVSPLAVADINLSELFKSRLTQETSERKHVLDARYQSKLGIEGLIIPSKDGLTINFTLYPDAVLNSVPAINKVKKIKILLNNRGGLQKILEYKQVKGKLYNREIKTYSFQFPRLTFVLDQVNYAIDLKGLFFVDFTYLNTAKSKSFKFPGYENYFFHTLVAEPTIGLEDLIKEIESPQLLFQVNELDFILTL